MKNKSENKENDQNGDKNQDKENHYSTPSKRTTLKNKRTPLGEMSGNALTPKAPLSSKSIFSPKGYKSIDNAYKQDRAFNEVKKTTEYYLKTPLKNFIAELKYFSKQQASLTNLDKDIDESIESLHDLMLREYESFKKDRSDIELKEDVISTFCLTLEIFRNRLENIVSKEKNLGHDESNLAALKAISTHLQKFPKSDFGGLFEKSIHFSQTEATDYFKATQTIKSSSPKILGKKVKAVGEDLKEHPAHIEALKIGVFIYKNQMVAENNRALSALIISKIPLKEPHLRLVCIAPSQLILNAYMEKLKSKQNPHQINLVNEHGKVSHTITTQSPIETSSTLDTENSPKNQKSKIKNQKS